MSTPSSGSRGRPRIRPTREETRERVIDAAAELFAERGVLGSSIEEIVARAGLSRGAFYSNFSDRNELAAAVGNRNVANSIAKNRSLLAGLDDPGEFPAEMVRRGPEGSNLLHIELLLHALRDPESRESYAAGIRTLIDGIAPVVEASLRGAGVQGEIDAAEAASFLIALEDGLTLHGQIDPERVPRGTYLDQVVRLQELAVIADRAGYSLFGSSVAQTVPKAEAPSPAKRAASRRRRATQ